MEMEDKILDSIREAEQEAKKIVLESNKKAEKIIAEAREKAGLSIHNLGNQLSSGKQTKREEIGKKIQEKKRKILDEGHKAVSDLEKTSSTNMKKAVELILKKFEEEAENA